MESVSGQTVAVFGAYGHTGRFVVAELLERGYVPILAGRDPGQLRRWPALAARRRVSTCDRRRSTTRPRSTARWPAPPP